jgi:hypothetical protein
MVAGFKKLKYILKPMSFRNLVAEFGHMTTIEIAAGQTYRIPLDIQVPGSILCISFQTLVAQGGDITFGLYAATEQTQFTSKPERESIDKKLGKPGGPAYATGKATAMEEDRMSYTHPIAQEQPSAVASTAGAVWGSLSNGLSSLRGQATPTPATIASKPAADGAMRAVIQPKLIQQETPEEVMADAGANATSTVENKPMKITYKIEERGFYTVVFTNNQNWMYSKTLKFRWCVLVPTDHQASKPGT